jgi:hypothetical protein
LFTNSDLFLLFLLLFSFSSWSRVLSDALSLLCLATWRVRPENPMLARLRRVNPTAAVAAALTAIAKEMGRFPATAAAKLVAFNCNIEVAPRGIESVRLATNEKTGVDLVFF